jgi:hypothetical protein
MVSRQMLRQLIKLALVLEGKISQVLGPRVRDYYALHGNVEGMLKRAGLIIIRAAPAHRA